MIISYITEHLISNLAHNACCKRNLLFYCFTDIYVFKKKFKTFYVTKTIMVRYFTATPA